ncbi:MAG: oxidoreductase molybdopterin binding protein [Pedosphaera sp.]|nr:oxidoreductase molybdopterin binding protein [Pedosphaera sp.]
MEDHKKPGILAGLFVGLMLTLVLTVIFYLAWKLAGLPFVPFDIFDWMTRVLPGQIIASGIDTMVKVIRALNLGPTAATAKLAEQSMAVGGMVVGGMIAGALFFVVERVLHGRYDHALGLAFGLAVGIPIMLLSQHLNKASEIPPWISAAWILLAFLAWGAAIGWVNHRLFSTVRQTEDSAEQASVKRINRRRFLVRLGGTTALITVTGAVVGRLAGIGGRQSAVGNKPLWSSNHPLPNADAEVRPVAGTRPEFTPLERHYRIDINTTPPTIKEAQWKLKIKGLVEKPLELTLDELRAYEPMHQFITLACISNPVGGDLIGTTRWTGVSLQRLLPSWQIKPEATYLKIRGTDGFYEVVALETIKSDERVMLAYEWDGVPLLAEHGFPLRIYVPNTYGMKLPKWIESIEVTDHWEPGYWVTRGWDKAAQMKTTSVIDAVGVNMNIVGADARTIVPIGGIAHAGSRGISKVEVQVDEGPWQSAALRKPLSQLTWVIWRYEWPFQRGKHTFTVRCYDGAGVMQSAVPTPMEPDGAAGLHSKTQMF